MRKRIKIELGCAVVMALAISALTIYANLPRQAVNSGDYVKGRSLGQESLGSSGSSGANGIQQSVNENIQGKMRKGFFESTVESLRTLTYDFGGIVPYVNMAYDNDLWSGTMNCNLPTENVTSFTFAVRQLVSANGTVTHIAITATETMVNQTGPPEEQLSQVSIGLREVSGGASPIMGQFGQIIPLLVTGLVWVAEGLILGVPLCFVSLGVVVMLDRAIIPAWKKQLKGRNMNKPAS